MIWDSEEIDLLKLFIYNGLTHEQIAIELCRTMLSIRCKCQKLDLKSISKNKTEEKYKTEIPSDVTLLGKYINAHHLTLHKHSCGYEWKVEPNSLLNGKNCPKCAGNKIKTHAEYLEQVPKDIIVLDTYIRDNVKLKHKHSCGHIWEVIPNSIINGSGCPICNIPGFDKNKKGYTYLIYFKCFGLYKIGISNNPTNRFKSFGYIPEILMIREFEEGSKALKLEKEWLNNVKEYMYNSGLLKSGNTETFAYTIGVSK